MSKSTNLPDPDSASRAQAASWWQWHGGRIRVILRVGLVLSLPIGAAWWFLFAPVLAPTLTVATGTITAEVMGTGTLEARTTATVGPKIAGLIVTITADQGDRVKAGALLFELEGNDLRQQVGIAESEVAAGTATLDKLRAAQHRAAAVFAQAKTNHERIEALSSTDVASRQDLDKAVEALAVAEADLSTAGASIIEGERRLDAAGRSLEYQRARLRETVIAAPFDGLVVRRDREPGDVVTTGASVLQLVSTDQMWITAWVDEAELVRLTEGQPARVIFRSEPGVVHEGVVARVGREVDRETREIVVDVRVEKLPAKWAVGQRAEVYIQVAHKADVTMLPAELVLVRHGATGVMVDVGGKAKWREITVGLRGRENVEIIDGLSPGDVVVSPTVARREGQSTGPK